MAEDIGALRARVELFSEWTQKTKRIAVRNWTEPVGGFHVFSLYINTSDSC
jgi:hypothetical protein